jgi:hypothetical protein
MAHLADKSGRKTKGFTPNQVINGYSLTMEGSNRFHFEISFDKGTESKNNHNFRQEQFNQITQNSTPQRIRL